MKRGVIEQRWSDGGESDSLAPRSSRREFFSCRRCAVECLVLAMLVSWAAVMCYLVADKYTECAASSGGRGFSYVNIRAWAGGLYWTAGRDGEVGVVHGRPHNSTWRMEEHEGGWFCLRHVSDLKLVEAIPSGGADSYSLRLRRYGCDSDAQRFKFQGKVLVFRLC